MNEKFRKSEESCFKLKEETKQLSELLKLEELAKQEKINVIQSLTGTLNDNKAELERLRQNFLELESNRQIEVNELQTQLSDREEIYEKQLNEIKVEYLTKEQKLTEEIDNLKSVTRKQSVDCEQLMNSLEGKTLECQTLKQGYERKITKLEFERKSNDEKIIRLEEQIQEINSKKIDCDLKYDRIQKEYNNTKALLESIQIDCSKHKDELFNVEKSFRELEMNCSLMKSEYDECKQAYETEKAFNKEKSKQIEQLKDSLQSSQTDIDELKTQIEKSQRSSKVQDELVKSLETDRDELRNTLTEIEKSRFDIKTKFDSSKLSCLTLENQLKRKEDEVVNLNRRLETLSQEKKLVLDELASAGYIFLVFDLHFILILLYYFYSKSLSQMKQLNEKLYEQTLSLQKKNSSLETKKYDPKYMDNKYSDKDLEIRKIKRENDNLKEQVSQLENEKRRIERTYVNLEKEFCVLKNSVRSPALNKRTSSPANSYLDQDSILSLTRLMNETNFGKSSHSFDEDIVSVEAKKIIRGIEVLGQNNLEIQQKVQGLENLIEAASSESDANTTRRSEDFRMIETGSSKSGNQSDFNGNHDSNVGNVSEKLRLAQLKAQTLIEDGSRFEKEVCYWFVTLFY